MPGNGLPSVNAHGACATENRCSASIARPCPGGTVRASWRNALRGWARIPVVRDAGECTIRRMTTNRTYRSGQSGDQVSFLPPCLEDYVGRDNPVRAVDVCVDSLELNELGFRDVGSDGGAGQPPYDPADLLRLYLYGYLHQVRSSRRLERETRRNVELMWLLRGLAPGYRTIANFRRDNAAGLKAANRDFVRLAGSLDLLGGALVAIDGAFFHGDASKASILTEKRLQERMAALDRSIAEYNAALEANDQAEAAAAPEKPPSGADMAQKLAALRQRRAAAAIDLAKLAESGDGQISRTDPDARLLAKHGQIVSGYNVQIAVDDKHKLIPAFARTASAVVNEGHDTGQLYALAQAAKEALGVAALTAVADTGYYNGATLKACEDAAITAYVPPPDRGQRLKAQGRFSVADFRYNAGADVYRCPAGAALRPMPGQKCQASGKMAIRYASRRSVCRVCPLRGRCSPGAPPNRSTGSLPFCCGPIAGSAATSSRFDRFTRTHPRAAAGPRILQHKLSCPASGLNPPYVLRATY